MKEGENSPVGLILCKVEARYALDNLPNKVLAAEYQMVRPREKLIADELKRSGRQLALLTKASLGRGLNSRFGDFSSREIRIYFQGSLSPSEASKILYHFDRLQLTLNASGIAAIRFGF